MLQQPTSNTWSYSRSQCGTTFKFSLDKTGKLQATIMHSGKKEHALLIKNLPLQTGLLDPTKLTLLEAALEKSYFTYTCGDVVVNARGLGGWGIDLHRGFYKGMFIPGIKRITNGLDTTCLISPTINNVGIPTIADKTKYGEGTYNWAIRAGFGIGAAVKIANANVSIDFGDTNPVLCFFSLDAQSWHFNTNYKRNNITNNLRSHWANRLPCNAGGSPGDSRIIHATEQLILALQTTNKNESLAALGKGLHALQDVYAHADQFVSKIKFLGGHFNEIEFFSHVDARGKHADDIFASANDPASEIDINNGNGMNLNRPFNKRYSNTKTASLLYMLTFLYCKTDWNVHNDIEHQATFSQKIQQAILGIRRRTYTTALTTNDNEKFNILDAIYAKIITDQRLADVTPFLGLFATLNAAGIIGQLRTTHNCQMYNDIVNTFLPQITTQNVVTTWNVTDGPSGVLDKTVAPMNANQIEAAHTEYYGTDAADRPIHGPELEILQHGIARFNG